MRPPRGRKALRAYPLLVLLLSALVVLLGLAPTVSNADSLDDAVHRVASQLECPICQGETVADSPSGLAADMRNVIRSKLQQGESDQQILQDFVASYGDSILTNPPKQGAALGVWVGPLLGLLAGLAILGAVAWRWRRFRGSTNTPPGPALLAGTDPLVLDELRRAREALRS